VTTTTGDRWAAGDAYEAYMGRWSRGLARRFLEWLGPASGGSWLEVGCGSGALTSSILAACEPASIVACDPSAAFVAHASAKVADPRATFSVAAADALPSRQGGFDMIVSGLVLNFVPGPVGALAVMRDRARPGGVVAAYVWDYAGGVEFLHCFWEEAVKLDESAADRDEARRFAEWQPTLLLSLFQAAGLGEIEGETLDVPTTFAGFDDYFAPFLGGTGPAPSYVASLTDERRKALRERLQARLAPAEDGSLRLRARAHAVRGVKP
jgi:SAM-dependent methyltransferase